MPARNRCPRGLLSLAALYVALFAQAVAFAEREPGGGFLAGPLESGAVPVRVEIA